MGLGTQTLVAFAATRRPEKAKAFYGHVLGLTLVADDPFAIVFDAHGTMLRVAKVDRVVAAPYTVLGWQVQDIAGTVRELTAAGVEFERYDGMPQDDLGIWIAPSGARIAWFRDPDGNILSLTQL